MIQMKEAAVMDPLLGRSLEGYPFLGLLGRGAFGAVYLSKHPRLERQVAVKYVKLNNPEEYEQAEHEIKVLSSLDHPHVVKIYDAYRYQDYQLIMMEFVRGGSLTSHIEELGKLDFGLALEAMIQVAEALHYVHSKNVLHLDLKPANILLDPPENGEIPRFVLTDFGIARFVQPGTEFSGFGGTPAYMAPEQFGFGEGQPDRRSDIYQFGVILYELAVGSLPFKGTNLIDYAQRHAYEAPPRPSERAKGLPPALDEIVLKAMAKSPAERFQSAGEISRALMNLRMTASPRASPDLTQRLVTQVKRKTDQNQVVSIQLQREISQTVRAVSPNRISLRIQTHDGQQRQQDFDKTPVMIGRGSDADLRLDQKTISRRHAQIEIDRSNQIYVTDLGSTHGTYLERNRLPANQRTLWPPNQRLIIEGFALGVIGAVSQPDTTIGSQEVKQLLDKIEQAAPVMPRVMMSASPEVVYVEMGRPQYIQVRVRPEHTPTARYGLRIIPGPGIDSRWYTVSADKQIEAGQTANFDLAIAAPGVEVGGGQQYELIVEVAADRPDIPSVFQVIKVSVVPYMRFNLALNPSEVSHRRRGKAKLIITNSGNYAETFMIRVQPPDRLSIQPKVDQIKIEPSKYEMIPLRFQPTRDASKEDRLLFSIMVSTQAGMTERVNGSYLPPRRRRIPWLAIVIIAIILAVAINFVVFGYSPQEQWSYFLSQLENLRQTVTDLVSRIGR